MAMQDEVKHERNLQATLAQVVELLDQQELESELVRKQSSHRPELVQSLLAKQQLAELEKKLASLHPADVAFVLEGLPLDQRQRVWELAPAVQRGAVLLELSEAVRDHLLGEMHPHEIIGATENLESDEIAYLLPSLSQDTVLQLLNRLDQEDRAQVQTVLSFPTGTVGALMEFDMLTVREDVTLEVVLRYLRKRGSVPDRTDQLFVVDREGNFKGELSLTDLVIHDPETLVGEIMDKDPVSFFTDDSAREAVQAFERYDLVTAPVVNLHGKLVGIIGIDVVVDYLNESTQMERLKQVGLREEEDLFAPIWKSGKNRWAWLAINLLTAFFASRVIGVFEGTIEKLVALAALMPIVASVGGNTGNQTAAIMIRGLALQQIRWDNVRYLLLKEVGIGLMNGVLWGSVVGLFAYAIYLNTQLALVMTGAMMLNLLIASLAGIFIPLGLYKLGRDPVFGSSVILTAITDSMGFFIFLGMATLFLR
jgi:magnesium transporter